jgi:hypothetical protein
MRDLAWASIGPGVSDRSWTESDERRSSRREMRAERVLEAIIAAVVVVVVVGREKQRYE